MVLTILVLQAIAWHVTFSHSIPCFLFSSNLADMDSMPPEILVGIFSHLKLHEKHILREVNQSWKQAADIAIGKQKQLVVYYGHDSRIGKDDVNGITFKQLRRMIDSRGVAAISMITELSLKTDQIDQWMVSDILQHFAPRLVKLTSSRSDVLEGIRFPSLKILECDRKLSGSVIESCPLLKQLSVSELNSEGWEKIEEMPAERQAMFTKLIVKELSKRLTDSISGMTNLTHLSITAYRVKVSDAFFKDMHQLQVVKLKVEVYSQEPDPLYFGTLTDAGVQVLLDNNPKLREVTFSLFPLTDLSIAYFTEYVEDHGLVSLTLRSCDATGFSELPAKKLATAGFMNKWKYLLLFSHNFKLKVQIN
jgi:hypothetical protein